MKIGTAARILWLCAAINGGAAIAAWGSTIGGLNFGISVATAVMAMRVSSQKRNRKTGEPNK